MRDAIDGGGKQTVFISPLDEGGEVDDFEEEEDDDDS